MKTPPTATGPQAVRCMATSRLGKAAGMAALSLLSGAGMLFPAVQSAPAMDSVAASRAALAVILVLDCRQHADCATMGIGARSCGGPEQYLAYSLRDTPGPAFMRAVRDYERLRKQQLLEREEMSTCELLPDPGAHCMPAGQCQLLPLLRGQTGPLAR